jgi:hypothetical protein
MTGSTQDLTADELIALKRLVYTDLLARNSTKSYTVREQMFTFDSLREMTDFLDWCNKEIARLSPGGGFSLARFGSV